MPTDKGKAGGDGEPGGLPASVPGSPPEGGSVLDLKAIGERLAEIRGKTKQEDFADELGVHKNTPGRYERGERPPDTEYLGLLSRKRNVSADWILFGLPPAAMSDAANANLRRIALARYHSEGLATELKAMEGDPDTVRVKLYDLEFGGGRGKLPSDRPQVIATRAFSRSWLWDEMGATVDDVFLGTNRGDSMTGVINDRDLVLVDGRVNEITSEDCYIIRIDDLLYAKFAQVQPGGVISIWSANAKVSPPFTVNLHDPAVAESFAVLGVAYWKAGRIRSYMQ